MEINNSISYLVSIEPRRRTVQLFLTYAQSVNSDYGEFLAYCLLSILNISVSSEIKMYVPRIEPDENANFEAWWKELHPVTRKFRTRREFVPFFIEMRNSANELLEEDDLFPDERLLTVVFMSLIGQYCAGKLHPDSLNRKFNYSRNIVKKVSKK